jgi:hypothetical protein
VLPVVGVFGLQRDALESKTVFVASSAAASERNAQRRGNPPALLARWPVIFFSALIRFCTQPLSHIRGRGVDVPPQLCHVM